MTRLARLVIQRQLAEAGDLVDAGIRERIRRQQEDGTASKRTPKAVGHGGLHDCLGDCGPARI